MIKDKPSSYYENRNLSDVFKELQAIKSNPNLQKSYIKNNTPKKHVKKKKNFSFKNNFRVHTTIQLPHLAMVVLIIFIAFFCSKNIFANSYVSEYEANQNAINIQNIISQNANIDTFKEQCVTEYNIFYSTVYSNNASLPKGEEVITKEGTFGKQIVSSVKTYKNQALVDEVILSKEDVSASTPQLVDVGTSDFLANNKVHIGDTMYVTEDCELKKSADSKSDKVSEIKETLDVKLIELASEEWCKVTFDEQEGYLPTSKLTSASVTPDIVEKCRIKRILINVDIDMELNKSSGLTKDDFQKILSDLPQDKNNIFKDNYETFYNVDTKYNVNGVFIAAIAIHESNWGTSTIANNKKNLFGYGAYDSSPYESSYSFDNYSDGIETVSKALVKYYLNPVGTEIYDDEIALGSYYNSPTVKGVNTKYASDKEWYTKVFKYMQLLYDKL